MSGWACMECGHRFKTVAAAKKAAFGDCGCPKCGGSDVDLEPVRKVPADHPYAVWLNTPTKGAR